MSITARAIPILSDNYAWLVRDEETGFTAIVDPAETAPIVAAIEAAGRLDMILLTHHHDDHIAAVDAVRARFPAPVVGNAADARRLPKLDRAVSPGDAFAFGAGEARVIDSPGHTIGHITYFLTPGDVLLSGDTLFSLGCGRLLEGTPAQMFSSLQALAALPGDTLVCCGHEYTESNARFALSADPDNSALRGRAAEVGRLRAAGQATVPTYLVDEMATNPFLRAADVATLADLRSRKDKFR
jgi:hydroxyacylglutathione hydrolase